ncbi:MAG: hypothetical protein SGPRY_004277, partial [Prymnesium sp.]
PILEICAPLSSKYHPDPPDTLVQASQRSLPTTAIGALDDSVWLGECRLAASRALVAFCADEACHAELIRAGANT